jgi:predicted solute-binding protein
MHLVQQGLVILHVFEHFNGHDAVMVPDGIQCALVVGDVALVEGK